MILQKHLKYNMILRNIYQENKKVGGFMCKVLIIDDNPIDSFELEKIIKDYDNSIEIKTAETGAKGLEMINEAKPDVVFMNVLLPILNGIEICRIVKEQLKMEDIKIILISSLEKLIHINILEEELSDGGLQKPFIPDQVINIMKTI